MKVSGYSIKDVCDVFDGPHATPSPSDEGPIYLGITSIREDGSIDYENSKRIAWDEFPKWTKRVTPKTGDVVFSYEANLGTYAIIPEGFVGCLGRRMAVMRPHADKVLPKYLYYYMLSPRWKEVIASKTVLGATVNRIPIASYPDFPIELPDVGTQAKVVAVLSAYDELIENNRRQIKLLEEAAQRLYKEWFVDLKFPGHETTPIHNGLPEGWKKTKLIEVADVQYGFAFKSSLFNTSGTGLPIIRIRNVKDGYSADFTTELADKRYLVNDGETVVGMDGDFYINSWSGGLAYLVQRSCRIRARDAAHDAYLRWALVEPLRQYQNGIVGATVAHLGKRHIDSIDVLIPPVEYMDSFTACRDSIVNCRRSIRVAREARDRLLPKLMSGEIEA